MTSDLKPGDRVKFSSEYRIAFPGSPPRCQAYRGTVIKQMSRVVFKVQWDATKVPERLHVSYLELANAD